LKVEGHKEWKVVHTLDEVTDVVFLKRISPCIPHYKSSSIVFG